MIDWGSLRTPRCSQEELARERKLPSRLEAKSGERLRARETTPWLGALAAPPEDLSRVMNDSRSPVTPTPGDLIPLFWSQ